MEALLGVEQLEDDVAQIADIKGLLNVVRDPDALGEVLDPVGAKGRHDDDAGIRGDLFGAQDELKAIDLARHLDVADEDIDRLLTQELQA